MMHLISQQFSLVLLGSPYSIPIVGLLKVRSTYIKLTIQSFNSFTLFAMSLTELHLNVKKKKTRYHDFIKLAVK